MKINLGPLNSLRRWRPSRKVLLVGIYILMVGMCTAVLAWRSLSVDRFAIIPPVTEAQTEEEVADVVGQTELTNPEEEYTAEELLPEGPAAPTEAPSVAMCWPVEGELLTGHHEVYRVNNQVRLHVGVDIKVKPDTLVVAAWPGIVCDVRDDSRLGLLMEIDHGGGYISQYANLDDAFFSIGDEVKVGEPIARAGQSAVLDAAEGTYLHFALYQDGMALDPVNEIEAK